jgi:hypothetical protein
MQTRRVLPRRTRVGFDVLGLVILRVRAGLPISSGPDDTYWSSNRIFCFLAPFESKIYVWTPRNFICTFGPEARRHRSWRRARKNPQTAFSLRAFLLFCSFQITAAEIAAAVHKSPPPAPAPARRRPPAPAQLRLAAASPARARPSSARARSPPPAPRSPLPPRARPQSTADQSPPPGVRPTIGHRPLRPR